MNSGDISAYYFHQGTNFFAYDYLGCNIISSENGYTYAFRTWAPSAENVELISDFTGWDKPLGFKKITDNGVWECIFSSNEPLDGKAYKYRITNNGKVINKGDPYARFSRGGSDGASVIYTSTFTWSDSAWLKYRACTFATDKENNISAPINIYEVHLESFMRGDGGRALTYRELGDKLAPYCKAMGYTHVEVLPIMEYPFSGSWGYQICAFYAPSCRFGTPDDFRYFVNKLHTSGIGVILDWVPAHFPKDEWGLYEFDGAPLYEYQGMDRQQSHTWGTRFFDLGREEVQSFLISNALYYMREFHVDGLRVDAVAAMLYLDYDRNAGEWIENVYGNNICLEAVAFFKKLNSEVHREFPSILMIAEESGDLGGLTHPVGLGGLGFNLKWNMGFANDFYDYVMTDPVYRRYKHKALNFPILYAFRENYCLPISHDEVVHGKLSFINKMHGDYADKFLQLRSSLMFFITFPGKKLSFMGTELAQFREWDFRDELEWFLLDYPMHRNFHEYVRSLNELYLKHPELWELDFSDKGFLWLLADEAEINTVAYRRYSKDGESLITVINFSGNDQSVILKVNECKGLKVLFETNVGSVACVNPQKHEDGEYYTEIKLGRFGGAILREESGKIKYLT